MRGGYKPTKQSRYNSSPLSFSPPPPPPPPPPPGASGPGGRGGAFFFFFIFSIFGFISWVLPSKMFIEVILLVLYKGSPMSFFVVGWFLVCLSCTWLFTLDLYTLERDTWWVVLLVFGILCTTAAWKGRLSLINSTKNIFSCSSLLCSAYFLPFPYQLGIIVVLGRDHPAFPVPGYSFSFFYGIRTYPERCCADCPKPSGHSMQLSPLTPTTFSGWTASSTGFSAFLISRFHTASMCSTFKP